MRPYSPGGALSSFPSARSASEPLIPSAHRLRRGLPGYLILFATHAFASQRQDRSSESLSPPAFQLISTHFTAHQSFHSPLPASRKAVCQAVPRLSRGISPDTCFSAYMRFKPSNSEQRLHTPYYRGCWHGVSQCFLWGRSVIPNPRQQFTSRGTSSCTRRRSLRLASIGEYSLLQPPVGVRTVSQFRCGGPRSHARYPSPPW